MINPQTPLARKNGLVVQEMSDEVLVYDTETNKAHCLNQTAAFVWKNCDGVNSINDIVNHFENQTGNVIEEDLIWLAIDQLNERKLLEKNITTKFAGESRRSVLKKIGLASVIALPIISSLTAPTAALAVACSGTVTNAECVRCNPGTPCTGGAGCPVGATCTCQNGVCTNTSPRSSQKTKG